MGDTDKEMVSFRVSKDTKEQIEEYATEQDISQSEAFRRLIRKGNELEKSGITISIDKNSSDSLITDGGAVREEIGETQQKVEELNEAFERTVSRSRKPLETMLIGTVLLLFATMYDQQLVGVIGMVLVFAGLVIDVLLMRQGGY